MTLIRMLTVFLCSLALISGGHAENGLGFKAYSKKAKFEDVLDDLREAIVKRGFVIDYEGHFNQMLERTADIATDLLRGGQKSPYRSAQYLQFCPARLTHESVAASPFGIANCPIALFAFELGQEPGTIFVGYRLPIDNPSPRVKEVNERFAKTLDEIARDAVK